MADDLHNASDLSDRGKPPVASNEDVDTKTARRELKQTYISEHDGKSNPGPDANSPRSGSEEDVTVTPDSGHASPALGKTGLERAQLHPRQASSPKKKRARDEFDEQKEGDADPKKSSEEGSTSDEARGTNTATATATATSATRSGPAAADSGGTSTQSRTDRLEPEKKRPRDHQDGDDRPREGTSVNIMASPTEPSDTEGKNRPLPATSAAAFAKSGFAKLASSSSPFGALAGAGRPSLFGSAAPRGASPFGSAGAPSAGAGASLGSTATAPKLSFGSTSAASPFATLNGSAPAFTSTFGPGFGGGGFGGARSLGGSSVLSGPRMTAFGKPGGSLKSDKPDRPFGAPESDEDDDSNEDDENEGENDDSSARSGEDDGSREKEKEKHRDEARSCAEEKKKTKLHKVKVDDGEGDEVTLLSVRARMFYMEKGVGWKERGMGMLKINVPKASVDLDRRGNPDPSTFDPSSHEDDEALALSTSSVEKREEDQDREASSGGGTRKGVRLLMRQDQTLRVILNTTLMPTMKFQLTQRLKAALVLFTAFEGDNASQVQMKMSEANATSFMQLVATIQERLAHV